VPGEFANVENAENVWMLKTDHRCHVGWQRTVRPDLQGNGLIKTSGACHVDDCAILAKYSNGFVT
jgi:hypothetical protein